MLTRKDLNRKYENVYSDYYLYNLYIYDIDIAIIIVLLCTEIRIEFRINDFLIIIIELLDLYYMISPF